MENVRPMTKSPHLRKHVSSNVLHQHGFFFVRKLADPNVDDPRSTLTTVWNLQDAEMSGQKNTEVLT